MAPIIFDRQFRLSFDFIRFPRIHCLIIRSMFVYYINLRALTTPTSSLRWLIQQMCWWIELGSRCCCIKHSLSILNKVEDVWFVQFYRYLLRIDELSIDRVQVWWTLHRQVHAIYLLFSSARIHLLLESLLTVFRRLWLCSSSSS